MQDQFVREVEQIGRSEGVHRVTRSRAPGESRTIK